MDSSISARVIFPKFRLHLACILLAASIPAASAEKSAGVTVTMNNGDIYIGSVLQAALEVDTRLGQLSIPVQKLVELRVADQNVRISTSRDEVVAGRLVDTEIKFSRLQDPILPLAVTDIANIQFAGNGSDQGPQPYTALLETAQGDRLLVKPRFSQLHLEQNGTSDSFPLAALRHIDSNLHGYEETVLTQLTLEDGQRPQGQLQHRILEFESPYLAELELTPGDLSRLSLFNEEPGKQDFVFSHALRSAGRGPAMVRLPGGIFLRGDFQGDGDDDEQPLAEVRLEPFAIGRFEVSFDEYALYCAQQRSCQMPDDQGWGHGSRPVINVSWLEARAYTDWLASQTGQAYRLPSDAEWEYAHRAGTTDRFPWGDKPGSARANCEGCGSIWDGDKTAPTGRFEPNAFGLYDTAGNVFEWVADCFHDRFAEAPADGSPIEKEGCGKRVIRGGAWSFPPHEIRSANRWRDFPSRRSDDTGFRVALDLE